MTKEHKEFVRLLNVAIDYAHKHGYNYMFLAGKDGTCARYLNGRIYDVAEMMRGIIDKNDDFKKMIRDLTTTKK